MSVFGRRTPELPPSGDPALRAAVDQVRSLVRDAARANRANKALVDLCLDVEIALAPPTREAA